MRYPMVMIPAYKAYLWGGRKLAEEYNKDTDLCPLAESWEISCHPDGLSHVGNGPYYRAALADVLKLHPDWMGPCCDSVEHFPLLIKLIDAKERLSLQVHPNDEWAQRVEGQQGKNELWYVLDATAGAELILGLTRPVSAAALKQQIGHNTVLNMVRRVKVQPGDCYCIPASMLHAIGAGVLIAEIQQSSNVTYRVYDYDRRDAAGNPRPLHVDKAVQVIDPHLSAMNTSGQVTLERADTVITQLTTWKYFQVQHCAIGKQITLPSLSVFSGLLALGGALHLSYRGGSILLGKGTSVFIPAGLEDCRVEGSGAFLFATAAHQP